MASPYPSHIAVRAHFQHKSPARPQCGRDAAHHRFRIVNPVQRRIGKHRIERVVETKIARIAQHKLQTRKILPRLRDHRGG